MSAERGTIVVVDDEANIADLVALYLDREGYRVVKAATGTEGLDAFHHHRPRLVVLDVGLPDIDGLEVCKRIRQTSQLPVIFLTARDGEIDRVLGLELGGDDYLTKPFSPAELVARVDAVLRRNEPAGDDPEPPLRVGEIEIDPAGRRVLVAGEEVALTQREFDLLLFLARHPGQVFTRDQLMEQVWRFSFYSDTSTVTVHIRRLRAKIEVDPAQPQYLQTVWGVGYRFQP